MDYRPREVVDEVDAAQPFGDLLRDLTSTGIGSVFFSAMSDWEIRLEQHRSELERQGFGERAMIATRLPRTKGQLVEFIEQALSYRFSVGQIVCATDVLSDEGNCVPIDWMWEIFCLARGVGVDGNELTKKEISKAKKEYLFKGPRGGSKTESVAALWWTLCWFCPNYSIVHTSTERAQSEKCLSYALEWAASPLFKMPDTATNKLKGVTLPNGSRFVILTATLDGLNKEHTISLSIDEVETFDMKLIGQAMQIPQEQVGCPYPSIVILASTQKRANLGMSIHIRDAILHGKWRYLIWNAFDVGARCEEYRREDLPEGLLCADHPAIIAEIAQLESIERTQSNEAFLQKLIGMRDALQANCPLVRDCSGKLIRGTGHLGIDTLRTRIQTLTPDEWESENLCRAPARGDSIYRRLSVENQSEEAVYKGEGQITYGAIDYGLVGASTVIVVWAINNEYVDIIHEYETTEAYEEDVVPICIELQNRFSVKEWCVDNAAVNLYRKMRKAKLHARRSSRMVPKIQKIDHMARLICDATGFRRLRFHPVNAYMSYEQMFHYGFKKNGKDPQDGDDDFCDANLYCSEFIRTRIAPQLRRAVQRPGRSLVNFGKLR